MFCEGVLYARLIFISTVSSFNEILHSENVSIKLDQTLTIYNKPFFIKDQLSLGMFRLTETKNSVNRCFCRLFTLKKTETEKLKI